jgi:hypothetical protein
MRDGFCTRGHKLTTKCRPWQAHYVCFGSLADIEERIGDVGFTPKSRHLRRPD